MRFGVISMLCSGFALFEVSIASATVTTKSIDRCNDDYMSDGLPSWVCGRKNHHYSQNHNRTKASLTIEQLRRLSNVPAYEVGARGSCYYQRWGFQWLHEIAFYDVERGDVKVE